MNAVPEWFTVEPDDTPYEVENVTAGIRSTHTGRQLHEGLPVTVDAKEPLRLIVMPKKAEQGTE